MATYNTDPFITFTYFSSYCIHTTVTKDPSAAAAWIMETETMYDQNSRRQLVVGLDCEWRPSYQPGVDNPVAILQLCVGNRCLIFQIIHSRYVPAALSNFLDNPRYTFAGVGIHGDVERLSRHYYGTGGGAKVVELGRLAAEVYGDDRLKTVGLKGLAMRVVGVQMEKPMHVRRGAWDSVWLSKEQVEYACIDCFLSYEIARLLISMGGVV